MLAIALLGTMIATGCNPSEAAEFRDVTGAVGPVYDFAADSVRRAYAVARETFVAAVRPAPPPAAKFRNVAAAVGPVYDLAADAVGRAYAAARGACLAAMRPAPPAAASDGGASPGLPGLVAEASTRFGVPERWIRAVMQVESDGDSAAVSPKGAIGLMQVMPDTYTELRGRHGLGSDPRRPRDNVLAGGALLRELYNRYGSPGFIAAYNAGPARYEDYLVYGRPLPDETLRYVAAVRALLGDEGAALGGLPPPRGARPSGPITVSAQGALVAERTGRPVSVTDRLALHALLEKAVQRAAR